MTQKRKDVPADTKQREDRKEDQDGNEDEFADAVEEGLLFAVALTVSVDCAGVSIRHSLAKEKLSAGVR